MLVLSFHTQEAKQNEIIINNNDNKNNNEEN